MTRCNTARQIVTLRSALILLPIVAGWAHPCAAKPALNGRHIFESNCLACHGVDGTGAHSSKVGFNVPLPDFTEASFSSREPEADWVKVAQEGGPARAFSEIMPAFGDALSEEELYAAVRHIKSFSGEHRWPAGELNLPRALVTTKAFPEDEVVYKGRMTPEDGDDSYKNVLEIEKRVGKAGQLILELVHENNAVRNELTEVEFGYKQALSWSQTHVLSAAAIFAAPVDSDDGDGELLQDLQAPGW